MQEDYTIYFQGKEGRLAAKIRFLETYSKAVYFVSKCGQKDLFFFLN